MKKDFIICVCAIVIGACGWIGSKQYDQYQARKFIRDQAAAAIIARQQLEAEKARLLQATQAKVQQAAQVNAVKKKDALAAQRKQVETELAGCKLSSIMLGAPSIAIIDKRGYEAGNDLALPSGKTLAIKSIDADAVLLADAEQVYRLALPKARDLGASVR